MSPFPPESRSEDSEVPQNLEFLKMERRGGVARDPGGCQVGWVHWVVGGSSIVLIDRSVESNLSKSHPPPAQSRGLYTNHNHRNIRVYI